MDKKQQVIQWLEDHKQDTLELLQKLVRIPSVSGNEYDVQMAVKAYAEEHGFDVVARAFDEEQRSPCLLITYKGTGNGKCLMLDAHSDTVPVQPDEVWEHDPFSGDFDGTWIHGRGATDDKWGIATALMTMRALKECGVELAGDLKFLSSVREEGNADTRREWGAGAMVRTMEKKPDFCIICEESGKSVGVEAPRNIKFSLHVSGKAVHTCVRRQCVFPQIDGISAGNVLGVDGLEKAILVMDAIYRLERDLSVNHRRGGIVGTGGIPGGARSSVGAVSINPTSIRGGNGNSTIANVTVDYSMHFSPTYTKEEMWQRLEDTVKGVAMTDLWLQEHPPVLTMQVYCPGFSCDPKHPAIEHILQAHTLVYGKETVVAPWVAGCDADAMPEIPCVVYGPSGAFAHAANERSKLRDLVDTSKVYAMAAMNFCK